MLKIFEVQLVVCGGQRFEFAAELLEALIEPATRMGGSDGGSFHSRFLAAEVAKEIEALVVSEARGQVRISRDECRRRVARFAQGASQRRFVGRNPDDVATPCQRMTGRHQAGERIERGCSTHNRSGYD